MNKLIYFLLLFLTFSCKKATPVIKETPQEFNEDVITPDDFENISTEEAKTYHVDKEHKYENRTGVSGFYEYNYDVIGVDEVGNEISGSINIENNFGAGKITDDKGAEINLKVRWIAKGELEGIDEEQRIYKLKIK